MEYLAHVLVPIFGCAMIFGIVYVVISANNRENMAMIAQGMNPKSKQSKSYTQLRNGILMALVPVGILVGNLVHEKFGLDPEPCAVVFSFLFGGLGLIATHFIEKSKKDSAND